MLKAICFFLLSDSASQETSQLLQNSDSECIELHVGPLIAASMQPLKPL